MDRPCMVATLPILSDRVMPTTAPAQTRLVSNQREERRDSPMGSEVRERDWRWTNKRAKEPEEGRAPGRMRSSVQEIRGSPAQCLNVIDPAQEQSPRRPRCRCINGVCCVCEALCWVHRCHFLQQVRNQCRLYQGLVLLRTGIAHDQGSCLHQW